MDQTFIRTFDQTMVNTFCRNFGMDPNKFAKTLESLLSILISTPLFGQAFDETLNITRDTKVEDKMKAFANYIVNGSIKKKVSERLKVLQNIKQDEDFKMKMGMERNFILKIQNISSSMASEADKVVKEENEIQEKINQFKVAKVGIRRAFETRWAPIIQFIRAVKIIKKSDLSPFLDSWLSLKDEIKERYGYSIKAYINAMSLQRGGRKQMELSRSIEFETLINSLDKSMKSIIDNKQMDELNRIISSDDFRFLSLPLETGDEVNSENQLEVTGERRL